jgi:hypothetical protein
VTDDLIARLRALAASQHDDLSVADEAANEIEALRNIIGRYVLLPDVELTDQFGNPHPAFTTVPDPSE